MEEYAPNRTRTDKLKRCILSAMCLPISPLGLTGGVNHLNN